ncbi:TolC family protein [Flavobacterium humi]|uniref:TolC family protein n=1 Tax=Flavobacterium humi TaxID=2562683 RepID=A0A4Z0L6M1_9FLAO|nr:TolC family protein [Flavobacterium humi]TGD57637.1 TolC family protein [Flavobacterium humi]
MRKIFILLAFAFLAKVNAQDAKQTYSFSLQQATEHALQYNYSAINSGRDIEAAKKKKWETTTMGLPQINGAVDYQNNFKIQKTLLPGELINQPGTFFEAEMGTKQNMGARLTLSQLIFDGSYIVGLQSAKVYLQLFENSKRKTDSEIRETVTNSYGNVLLAEESIKVLERNQSILEKNYKDANQIYKNGLGEEESVEQISITLATVKSNLNNVKRLREVALKMLKINLGIELNDELTLTDNLEALSQSNLALALESNEFNVNNTVDYQIVSNMTEQKKLLLKLEKSKALPSLAANVNFGYNAFSQSFSFFNENQKWYNYSNLGVGLNVPIFSSLGRSARTQQAKIAYEQAKTSQTETEQMLKLQFEKSKSEFEFSIEEYATAKSNLNLAERIEKKQQTKFAEGLSTSFEFTEAQRQLYSAQQSYLQSMVDVINKRAALEKIIK